MENTKESGCHGDKGSEENPDLKTDAAEELELNSSSQQPSRTPFTNLSQVDSDMALARALQEQERAYMMLRMNSEPSEYDSSESGSYVYEEYGDVESDGGEDIFDVHSREVAAAEAENEIDPSAFDSDEAYARALQDAEEREAAIHLMALTGIHNWEGEDSEEEDSDSQDAWQEVDPDELSYEELLALGEVVGTESRGLSADTIASLPLSNYKAQNTQDDGCDQCVICRLDYEEGDGLIVLSCKHTYHSECINNWLQIKKVCPVCSTEVSTSENRI